MQWENFDEATRWYIGGQLDGDGTVSLINGAPRIRLTKSVKAARIVVQFRDWFGGCITTRLPKPDSNDEASCTWEACGLLIKKLCQELVEYTHGKQPQFDLAGKTPLGKTPLLVTKDGLTTAFDYRKDVANMMGITESRIGRLLRGVPSAEYNGYLLVNVVNPNEVRAGIAKQLTALKAEEHRPVDRQLHPAYFAGFADAEMCVFMKSASNIHINIPQKSRAILDAMQQIYGGSVTAHKTNSGGFIFTICGEACRQFLQEIAPFMLEKDRQVKLALTCTKVSWMIDKDAMDAMKGVCVRVGRGREVFTQEQLDDVMQKAGM